MPKFNVSVDIRLPVLLEITARDEEDAIDKLNAMSLLKLLELANKDSAELVDGSEWVDPA